MTEATIKCPISGKPMEPAFTGTILNKHEISYYYSKESGLLKTEKPYWLDEAYSEAISKTDTGLVQRNIGNSDLLTIILECLSIANGTFLDIGGGYGLLTRLMRDKGFDCHSTDKYCKNIFAQTFEPKNNFKYDALFAFEILEHIIDPLEFLRSIFNQYSCKTVIFSTLTFTDTVPAKDWWYYSFESGQHVTFYQPRTLALLADQLGCKHFMLNPAFHIITDIKMPLINRMILFNKHIWKLYSIYVQKKRKGMSKTWDDHLKMKDQLQKN